MSLMIVVYTFVLVQLSLTGPALPYTWWIWDQSKKDTKALTVEDLNETHVVQAIRQKNAFTTFAATLIFFVSQCLILSLILAGDQLDWRTAFGLAVLVTSVRSSMVQSLILVTAVYTKKNRIKFARLKHDREVFRARRDKRMDDPHGDV